VLGATCGKAFLRFLCNDIDMIFWILIIFDMFAGAAEFHQEPQELIHA